MPFTPPEPPLDVHKRYQLSSSRSKVLYIRPVLYADFAGLGRDWAGLAFGRPDGALAVLGRRAVALIMDFRARVLRATPSYALAPAEVAETQRVNLRNSALRVGLFGAEPWSQAMRSEIEARLGLKAVDIYGLSEIMGPGVACECECRQALHGWEDHFLFEVIDPETGQALPEGQAGELVITTLTKQALPSASRAATTTCSSSAVSTSTRRRSKPC